MPSLGAWQRFDPQADPQRWDSPGFQRSLRLAGLSRIRFHDLRHVHAMLLLRNGVDIAVVRDVLGHSSSQLTADTYAGIMPALKEDAAARFEKPLQRPG